MKFLASNQHAIEIMNDLRSQGKIVSITGYKDRWIVSVNYCGTPTAAAEGKDFRLAVERAYNAYLVAGGEA